MKTLNQIAIEKQIMHIEKLNEFALSCSSEYLQRLNERIFTAERGLEELRSYANT